MGIILKQIKEEITINTEYNDGMNDLMSYIRKMFVSKRYGGIKEDLFDIFGKEHIEDVLNNFEPIAIKELIDKWKRERANRIDIGDIISVGVDGELTLVVTYINEDSDEYEGISSDGQIYTYPRNSDYIYKSKNHIDIFEILDKIKHY